MEVYSCGGWPCWPLQKCLGETALFMESCMPYLRCFLLCIPVSVKITPRDGCPDVWPTLVQVDARHVRSCPVSSKRSSVPGPVQWCCARGGAGCLLPL